jgi:DNA-binding NtrC family response regulator
LPSVLVVEDDEQVRVLAESILEEAGHTVVSAEGGAGAEALLDSDQPIDILFIDINIGADIEAGLRIAKDAVKRRPNLRVIYTTGHGINDGMQALFVKPFQFVAKPYTASMLVNAVNNAFEN